MTTYSKYLVSYQEAAILEQAFLTDSVLTCIKALHGKFEACSFPSMALPSAIATSSIHLPSLPHFCSFFTLTQVFDVFLFFFFFFLLLFLFVQKASLTLRWLSSLGKGWGSLPGISSPIEGVPLYLPKKKSKQNKAPTTSSEKREWSFGSEKWRHLDCDLMLPEYLRQLMQVAIIMLGQGGQFQSLVP